MLEVIDLNETHLHCLLNPISNPPRKSCKNSNILFSYRASKWEASLSRFQPSCGCKWAWNYMHRTSIRFYWVIL